MKNIYEKDFLNAAVKLDALLESAGLITGLARKIIIDANSDNVKCLYSELNTIVDSNSRKESVTLAMYLKECMFKLIGYNQLVAFYDEKEYSTDDKCLNDLIDDLDALVGLENVKEQVKNLVAFQLVNNQRISYGLISSKRTLHLAFIGNPGTGKTTVARIVGRMYKELGILSKGHFIEVSRTDLIAGYQGQTALKVKKVIDKARGGVLFIDEAYSITENDHTDSYGRECLTELTKALEDYRDDLVVIVAGYTNLMEKFFESNPGLKSRFNTIVEFDDYSSEQLLDILQKMCNENDYEIDSESSNKLLEYFNYEIENKENNFANGRLARNVYEKLIMNHARRVVNIVNPSKEDLSMIILDDLKTI